MTEFEVKLLEILESINDSLIQLDSGIEGIENAIPSGNGIELKHIQESIDKLTYQVGFIHDK